MQISTAIGTDVAQSMTEVGARAVQQCLAFMAELYRLCLGIDERLTWGHGV